MKSQMAQFIQETVRKDLRREFPRYEDMIPLAHISVQHYPEVHAY